LEGDDVDAVDEEEDDGDPFGEPYVWFSCDPLLGEVIDAVVVVVVEREGDECEGLE
jgi:hypothetical protein